MKRCTQMLSGLAVAAVALAAGSLHATILAVDFERESQGTNQGTTETGFESFALPAPGGGTHTETYGDLTVSITGQTGNYNQGINSDVSDSGAFTFAALYEDFTYVNSAGSQTIDIVISGLTPTTPYQITLYSYDDSTATGTQTTTFAPTVGSGTTGAAGQVTFTGANDPTTNDQYAATVLFTSDGHGDLSISASAVGTNTSGAPYNAIRVNGFEIIPEPATAALLVVGSVLLLGERGRHADRWAS